MLFLILFLSLIHVGHTQLYLHTEVDIGGCFDTISEEFIHCAAVEKECEEVGNVRFRSAKQLKFIDIESCTAEQLGVGVCGDTGQCALTEDACEKPSEFIAPTRENDGTISSECNAKGVMIDEVFHPTQYGGCKDGVTGEVSCMLTPDDCSQYEAWIPANVVETIREGGCRCNDVRVGLCEGFGSTHSGIPEPGRCAISPDDCEFSAFVPPTDVLKHPSLVDCRLCNNHDNLEISISKSPTISSSAEPSSEIESSTNNKVEQEIGVESSSEIESSINEKGELEIADESSSEMKSSAMKSDEGSDSGSMSTVVIISCAVALFTLLVVVAMVLLRLKKRKRGNEDFRNRVVPPNSMN